MGKGERCISFNVCEVNFIRCDHGTMVYYYAYYLVDLLLTTYKNMSFFVRLKISEELGKRY